MIHIDQRTLLRNPRSYPKAPTQPSRPANGSCPTSPIDGICTGHVQWTRVHCKQKSSKHYVHRQKPAYLSSLCPYHSCNMLQSGSKLTFYLKLTFYTFYTRSRVYCAGLVMVVRSKVGKVIHGNKSFVQAVHATWCSTHSLRS